MRNLVLPFIAAAGVDARDVLEKVAALSIQTRACTSDTRGTRHVGPIALNF